MRRRERTALNLTPLCLRLPLALIFVWAGLNKIVTESQVSPDQAIVLQAHGVAIPNAPTPPAPAETPPPAQDEPGDDLPETPAPDPTSDTPAAPLPDPAADPADTIEDTIDDVIDDAADDVIDDTDTPDTQTVQSHAPRILLVQDGAADPDTYTVRSVYQLVLVMDQRANPESRADGSPATPTWPQALAAKPWTKVLAWAVAITEVFAGFFLLIGLITRLSALALSGVMVGAVWLTTLAPAIETGNTFLGFLPNEPFLSFFWKDPFFQLICLMACLALFFSGSGTLALDRAIFGSSRGDDWDDDDDDARDRSSFDRAP